jgi:hypothetical protein
MRASVVAAVLFLLGGLLGAHAAIEQRQIWRPQNR